MMLLYLDGVYAEDAYGKVRFHRVKAPTAEELGVLVNRISRRVAKFLERRGFLERDEQSSYLTLATSEDEAMQQLSGHSITYRIAIGPQQGRKVFTLQSLPPVEEPMVGSSRWTSWPGLLRWFPNRGSISPDSTGCSRPIANIGYR